MFKSGEDCPVRNGVRVLEDSKLNGDQGRQIYILFPLADHVVVHTKLSSQVQ